MNSLERIFTAVKGEKTDRRPASALLSLYGAGIINARLEKYYTDPGTYARGQCAIKETFDPDILFSPFVLTYYGSAFGSSLKFFDNAPPNISKPAAPIPDMVRDLKMPDTENDPYIMFIRESVKLLSREFRNEVPIAAITLSPVDLPAMILGIENWMEILLFRQELIQTVFSITVPFFIEISNKLVEDGASFIVLPLSFVNPDLITREICEQITLPVLGEAFSKVKAPIVIHAGGVRIVPFLESFDTLPNVLGFAVNGGEHLPEARSRISHKKMLLGNIDGPTLNKYTCAAIEEKCMAILSDRKDDPYFILQTTAADIPLNTPAENIHTFLGSVKNFQD